MPVTVWRLARAVYPVLDGEGARRFGGRWNAPGTAVVYTATHLSLAVLEMLVHLDPDVVPEDLLAFEIAIPDAVSRTEIREDELPEGWQRMVECPVCRRLGERWVEESKTAVLRVPSALVVGETNVLLNPSHEEGRLIHVVRQEAFRFDPRLLRRR